MKTFILKVLCLTLILFTSATGLLTEAALSTPLVHKIAIAAQAPVVNPSPEETPSNETITSQSSASSEAKSQTANSDRQPADSQSVESERAKQESDKTPSVPAGPYDMRRIQQFNRALYGS
ncbi:MAG TPA: hypothetical protein V6D50_06225 [Chroococcales cyanobacterium]|jgi:hypothetical protein